jgi:hypothetical protein
MVWQRSNRLMLVVEDGVGETDDDGVDDRESN